MATTSYGSYTSNRMMSGVARVRRSGGAKPVQRFTSPKMVRYGGRRRKSSRRF